MGMSGVVSVTAQEAGIDANGIPVGELKDLVDPVAYVASAEQYHHDSRRCGDRNRHRTDRTHLSGDSRLFRSPVRKMHISTMPSVPVPM